jgi:large subunit ribosomal protein L15
MITGFEGGQMPLYRRLPKRGFKSRSASAKAEVSLTSVLRAIETGKLQADQEINLAVLRDAGLIRKSKAVVKIIGRTEVPMALMVNVSAATEGARQSIQENGGTCVTSSRVSQ